MTNNSIPTIGLYRGKSWVSRAIMFQTRGEYSHAAIHFNDYVIEPWASSFFKLNGKVYKRPFGEGHKKDTPVDIFTLDSNQIDMEKLAIANAWLLEQVGKAYDFRMVAGFVTRRHSENRKNSNKWFCSELVYAYLVKLGVIVFERTLPFEVSPTLLKRLPLLEERHTIFTEAR